MGGCVPERRRLSILLLLLALACSSAPRLSARDVADANDTGRALAAKSDDERGVLGRLAVLPSGKHERVGGATVMAEAPYTAASGRTCRALRLTQAPTQAARRRLACSDGKAWFFVPDVFEAENDTAPE